MGKQRLDILVARQGLAESREQAQRLIMAGDILVNGQPVTRSASRFDEGVALSAKARPRFVSRGGEKLDGAFRRYPLLRAAGRSCLDVGASTGGFTDCLLRHGAARVLAVDVGKGQLHWRLRTDSRVQVMEGVNARYLDRADLPFSVDLATIDVSFISLRRILPAVVRVLEPAADIVALVKPRFEAGRKQVGKGGVVRDEAVRQGVAEGVRSFAESELALRCKGLCDAPLAGPAGNLEFLMWLAKGEPA